MSEITGRTYASPIPHPPTPRPRGNPASATLPTPPSRPPRPAGPGAFPPSGARRPAPTRAFPGRPASPAAWAREDVGQSQHAAGKPVRPESRARGAGRAALVRGRLAPHLDASAVRDTRPAARENERSGEEARGGARNRLLERGRGLGPRRVERGRESRARRRCGHHKETRINYCTRLG